MATSSTPAFPKKRNRCTLPTLSLFLLFFFCLFFFSRRVLEPKLFIYRDFISQTSVSLLSPPRSTELDEKFDDLRKPVLSVSNPVENVDGNITSSSEFSEPEFQEEINEKTTVKLLLSPSHQKRKQTLPFLSKSDLDDKNREKQVEEGDTETEGVVDNAMAGKLRNCDIYKGKWVRDEGYPLYGPGSCPYVDEAFDCQNNGRPDSDYLKWRWKPDECHLPRFNATDFLDYNCTVEFVRSHFLVREGVRINAQGNSNPTLSIDKIDKTARRWQGADILVFNTGHWWTHGKTSRVKTIIKNMALYILARCCGRRIGEPSRPGLRGSKKNLAKEKLVFYRGYSSAHFRGGDWDSGGSCNGETKPVVTGAILDSYPEKMTTWRTPSKKHTHRVYGKNVTAGKKVSTRRQDCSHWCLPGVPDAWNELIYTTLVARQT
ncbi:hypothetical protein DH2020_006376 [Rehmannia glutinosa]|uniref:Trichome birefringence-like N-terminal domain-containing protein n=1 Tax=Rehmannia glutinosa TaxID=99300 RepID=A0ABR0XIP3_REHGL